MSNVPPWIVSDDAWALVASHLPAAETGPPKVGRKPLSDRKALSGVLFVLVTGIRWEFLPPELGFGTGMTCWRRLKQWNEIGAWPQMQNVLEERCAALARLNWSRAAIRVERSQRHKPRSA